jgi:hypothetical protein
VIDVLTLAAQFAVAEVEAEHVQAAEHRPVSAIVEAMRAELTPKFQEIFDDTAPRSAVLTGKRTGKSECFVRMLAAAALLNPRTTNPYILPTAKQARRVAWPLIKRVVERHIPDAKILDHEMTVTMPEGGLLIAGGCECRADIGRWFGFPFGIAAVDECGTFPPYLRELVDDGLEPSTMDYGGRIVMAGNPGVAPIGYWYELTGASRISKIPLYTGDARENPHVKAAEFFARKLEDNGWTEEHPTFQRMYLGRWCADPSALCFPYLQSRNAIDALPERSLAGGQLLRSAWRFVIGADVAGLGITSIVVLAAHPGDPRTFGWSSESHPAWLPEQLVTRVRTIKADTSHGYDMSRAAFVVDTGGLGSVHNVHLTRKASNLYHEAADKADKKSSIRDVHDEMIAGRMQWLDWSLNDGVRGEMAVLEWDEKHELWIDGPPDHEMDATLYAKRRIRQYANKAAGEEDRSASAIAEREAAKLKQARERKVSGTAKGGRPAWDR